MSHSAPRQNDFPQLAPRANHIPHNGYSSNIPTTSNTPSSNNLANHNGFSSDNHLNHHAYQPLAQFARDPHMADRPEQMNPRDHEYHQSSDREYQQGTPRDNVHRNQYDNHHSASQPMDHASGSGFGQGQVVQYHGQGGYDEYEDDQYDIKPEDRSSSPLPDDEDNGEYGRAHEDSEGGYELHWTDSDQFYQEQDDMVTDTRGRAVSQAQELGFPAVVDQQFYILQLHDAILNTDGIADKPCKDGKPCQAAQRLMSDYYPREAIEKACWKLLIGLQDAQAGHRRVEPYHRTKYEGFDDFEARFESLRTTLYTSKASCKMLLDPSFLDRLCDAPRAELTLKEMNKKVNAERDYQNLVGRKMIAKKDDEAKAIVAQEEAKPKATPAKKTRNRGKATTTPRSRSGRQHTPDSGNPFASRGSGGKRTARGNFKQPAWASDEEEEEESPFGYTHGHASTPATGQRPRRSHRGPVNYQDADFEGNTDDDGDFEPDTESPLKKARYNPRGSNQSRGQMSGNANRSLPSARFGAGSFGVEDGLPRDSPARMLDYGQNQSGPSGSRANYDPDFELHLFQVDGAEMYNRYRYMICHVLGIDPGMCTDFALTDLRRYARAYNLEFRNFSYIDPDLPRYEFRGVEAARDGTRYPHFALVDSNLAIRRLAELRGDIDAAGHVIEGAGRGGFDLRTKPDCAGDYRALGVYQDFYGTRCQLYPSLGNA